jgi:hypothetical protein
MARAWIWVVAAADDKVSGTVTIESKSVLLRNHNGVVLDLTSTQTGVKFTLAGEGIEVKLK